MTEYYVARKIVLAWAQEKDGQPGYAVKYRDGYISWCPKEKFEEDNLVLGHSLGMYTYEQQLVMAELAEFEIKREALFKLEEEGDELASIERKVVSLYIDVLQRKIAKFAKVHDVEKAVTGEPKTVAGDGSKTYFPVPLSDFSDFNFISAGATMVDQIKGIASIRLSRVMRDGVDFEIVDPLNVRADGNIQLAGQVPGVGIFNIVVDPSNGDVQQATRPADGGSFAGIVFGFDVEWVGPDAA